MNDVPSSFSVTWNVFPRCRARTGSSTCTRVSSVFGRNPGNAPFTFAGIYPPIAAGRSATATNAGGSTRNDERRASCAGAG